jgi:hypothetical protein
MGAAVAPKASPVRVAFFWLLAAIIIGGPFVRQVLGVKGRLLPAWQMFHVRALDTVRVRYTLVGPDGARSPVDRYTVLNHPRGWADTDFHSVLGARELDRETRDLCRALRVQLGRSIDLRREAEIPDVNRLWSRGWSTLDDGAANVCARLAPETAVPAAPPTPASAEDLR